VVSAQVRREQAQFAMERGLSQRRACVLMQVSRSSLGYTLKMPPKNAPVIEAMCSLSGVYPRFGSRRIRVLLGRVRYPFAALSIYGAYYFGTQSNMRIVAG